MRHDTSTRTWCAVAAVVPVALAAVGTLPVVGAQAAVGWGPIVTISGPDTYSGARVAVDRKGNATAVWRAEPGGVWAARRVVGKGWRAPVRIGRGNDPRVGVDGAGVVTALWRGGAPGYAIWSARRTATGWKAPVRVSEPAPDMAPECNAMTYRHDLAVGAGGAVTASWEWGSWDCGPLQLQVAIRPDGRPWRAPKTLTSWGADSQVGVDRAGNVTVAYSKDGIQVVRKPVGRPWTAPKRLGPEDIEVELAVNPAGAAMALIGYPELKAVRRPVSGPWGTPVQLAAYASDRVVALDGAGTATAAYTTDVNLLDVRVMARRQPAGKPWRAAAEVAPAAGQVGRLAIGTNAAGHVALTWQRSGVRAAFRPVGGPWGSPTLVALQRWTNPDLGLAGDGDTVAVWVSDPDRRTQARIRNAG
jgi:hypothetical protein